MIASRQQLKNAATGKAGATTQPGSPEISPSCNEDVGMRVLRRVHRVEISHMPREQRQQRSIIKFVSAKLRWWIAAAFVPCRSDNAQTRGRQFVRASPAELAKE